MAVIGDSVYLVGCNFMGQGLVRELVQLLIVPDCSLWWKSKTLAYFKNSSWLLDSILC